MLTAPRTGTDLYRLVTVEIMLVDEPLECLRHAPYKELKAAMDASPGLSGYEVRDNAHGANGLRLTGAWTVAFTCVDASRRWRLFDQ